jgi:hypothetical protein
VYPDASSVCVFVYFHYFWHKAWRRERFEILDGRRHHGISRYLFYVGKDAKLRRSIVDLAKEIAANN